MVTRSKSRRPPPYGIDIRALGDQKSNDVNYPFPCSEVETGLWLAPDEIDAWTARRPG